MEGVEEEEEEEALGRGSQWVDKVMVFSFGTSILVRGSRTVTAVGGWEGGWVGWVGLGGA